jgi:hypothetical protein
MLTFHLNKLSVEEWRVGDGHGKGQQFGVLKVDALKQGCWSQLPRQGHAVQHNSIAVCVKQSINQSSKRNIAHPR